MGIGIILCGLNGGGKSTLGKALSEKLKFHFIDNENLFFAQKNVYASPRSHEEATQILTTEIKSHQNFILASVKGDYGKQFLSFLHYAIIIDVPKDIRLKRVRSRAFEKFGDRMLPGGDLYESQEQFFEMINGRTESYVEEWLQTLSCEVIRIDGTKPIEENITIIIKHIYK